MTIARHEIIKWALAGAAFVLVLTLATGCSTGSRQAVAPAPAVPVIADPTPAPVFGVVNAFGEIDGLAPGGRDIPQQGAFQRHTFAEDGGDTDVALDPTGRWLVYASTRHSEAGDIYLQRVDGVSVVRLTDDPAQEAFPAFSPDGTRIAFSSTRAGSWDVYVTDINGKNVTQLTSGPAQDLHPSFSPDGRWLVYCSSGGRSGQWELWVVELQTGARRMIGYGLFPEWSPDKTVDRIAFQRARQRGSRWFSLWTLDLVDGEARRVTEVSASAGAAIVHPSWSPDGQRLAFATIVEPDAMRAGSKDVWVINADGTGRQRLSDGTGANFSPFWASTGRIFFLSDRAGSDSIWSAQAPSPEKPMATAENVLPARPVAVSAAAVDHSPSAGHGSARPQPASDHAATAAPAVIPVTVAPAAHHPAPAAVVRTEPAAAAPEAARPPAPGPAIGSTDTHEVGHH